MGTRIKHLAIEDEKWQRPKKKKKKAVVSLRIHGRLFDCVFFHSLFATGKKKKTQKYSLREFIIDFWL